MTTTISTGQDIATLINVFTVNPDNQQQLVDLLDEATNGAALTTLRTCLPIPPPANT